MKGRSGVILGVTLVMFLIMAVLGTTIMAIAMSKARQTNDLEKRTQAYFFARSGVDIARDYVSKASVGDKVHVLHGSLSSANGNVDFSLAIFDKTGQWQPSNIRLSLNDFRNLESIKTSEVVVAVWKEGQTTRIISMGMAGDAVRVVTYEGTSATSAQEVINMALYASGQITIGSSNNYAITGKVGTGLSSISNYEAKKIPDGAVYNLSLDYKLPPFPPFPSLSSRGSLTASNNQTIGSDGYYSKIVVGNNTTLYIDTGATDTVRKIVIDELDLRGSILLKGNGDLELYVRRFTSDPSGSINKETNADPARVTLYTTVSSVSLESFNMVGTIYIEGPSSVTLGKGGNGLKIHGLIMVGGNSTISTTGNSVSGDIVKSVLYAPYSTVDMSGTSSFNGAIVAKTLNTSGGGGSGGIVYMIDGLGETLDPIVVVNASELWGE